MDANSKKANWPFGLIGAVGGGIAGYFVFILLANIGLYALILPGASLGLGAGALLKEKSIAFGAVCGFLAVMLGFFAEWRFAPFIADASFGFFIAHLHHLSIPTLIMVALGGLCAYWFGQGR